MAVIPPPGKTGNRRPSLRGVLMQDVSQGTERNRIWPAKRKAKLSETTKDQNDWFRQAQWATKYFAPEIYKMWAKSVAGTPLLPRDIMTMLMSGRLMAINTPDGKIIYPKVAAMDVSESLDTISQVLGDMLIRNADRWVGVPAGGAGLLHAKCNFTPGATPVISGNLNISSITRTAAGRYRVRFVSQPNNLYYQLSGSGRFVTGTNDVVPIVGVDRRTGQGKTLDYVDISINNENGSATDSFVYIDLRIWI